MAITGASGGIGRALAHEFAAQGCALTLVARRREQLEELAHEVDVPAHVVGLDLADSERAVAWIPSAEAELGPIDVLINNAGTVISQRFSEVTPDEAARLAAVDYLTPLRLIHVVLPAMLRRRCGTIVNIASTGALAPNPGMVDYCGAKAGLAAASEALRGELRRTGVRVVTVYPGPIATDMLRAAQAGYPKLRRVSELPMGKPEELARRVRIAVERGHARVIYPRVYTLFRYLPGLARIALDRMTPEPLARHPDRSW